MRAAKRLSARDGGDVRGGLDAARGAAEHGEARDGEEDPCAWDRDALAAAPYAAARAEDDAGVCALVPEEGAAVRSGAWGAEAAVRTDDAAEEEEEDRTGVAVAEAEVHSVAEGAAAVRR